MRQTLDQTEDTSTGTHDSNENLALAKKFRFCEVGRWLTRRMPQITYFQQ